MVLSRRGLSVILLAVVALVFYLVLLSTTPTTAQTGGDITSQDDEGCSNPQVLETFTGTESQRTPTFNVTGNTLRISFETEATNPDAVDENLAIRVLDEAGSFVDSVLILQPEAGSDNIFVDPGTYSLQIDAGQEVQYSVTVEDCVGNESTDGNTVDDEITVQEDEDLQEDVIIEEPTTRERSQNKPIVNIPNKPLPPTGGLPVYGTVAGSILVGAGLLGLGVGIRRGQRR